MANAPFRFDVLTLFPGLFEGFLGESLIGKAVGEGRIAIGLHDWRPFAENKHGRVDDAPFGGGAGMVLAPGPVVRMLEQVDDRDARPEGAAAPRRVLLSPAGRPFDQVAAQRFASGSGLVLLCGRYEGFDARVEDEVDELLSLGDYVLNGGEVAAMVVIEAVARLLPGVIGNAASLGEESHAAGLLEAPHYTRPREFRGREVPEILLSGDHGKVAAWRHEQALRRTAERRPELHAAWLRDHPPPPPKRSRKPRRKTAAPERDDA